MKTTRSLKRWTNPHRQFIDGGAWLPCFDGTTEWLGFADGALTLAGMPAPVANAARSAKTKLARLSEDWMDAATFELRVQQVADVLRHHVVTHACRCPPAHSTARSTIPLILPSLPSAPLPSAPLRLTRVCEPSTPGLCVLFACLPQKVLYKN